MDNEHSAVQPAPAIYQSLNDVQAELAVKGIDKSRRNEQQGYRFRGIDDVFNAASSILAKHRVVCLPCYSELSETERITTKGGTLIFSKVRGDFRFVSAKDGSSVTVTTFGSGMDASDKSVNKSMTAALKYAILQTFLIPTEAGEDADAVTPDPSVPKPPVGFDDWFGEFLAAAEKGNRAFGAAWKKGADEFRLYASTYRKDQGEIAKARAAEVTAQQAAQ